MGNQPADPKSGFRFSAEVRLGELIAAIGIIGTGALWWGNVNAEFAGLKASQAAQSDQTRRLDASIQEVKQDVKDTRESVRGLERRMDRARM